MENAMNAVGKSARSALLAATGFGILWMLGPGCERSKMPVDGILQKKHSQFNLGDTVTLAYREIAGNESTLTFLQFDSILEDSRCPADVMCFWEGNARISFLLEEPGGRHRFALNTYAGFTRDTSVAGRRVALIGVLPRPPGHDRRLDPEDYRAVITVR
jgi:hypothetical protein